MKQIIFILISIVIFTACSSSEEITKKEITSEVSENTIVSQTGKLSVKLPSGWINTLDNTETVFDIWLVSPANNAVIGFTPLSINNKVEDIDNDEDAIKLLTKFARESKKNRDAEFLNEDEEIIISEINGFMATNLKYEIDGKFFNSIIFGKDKVYYECLSYFSNKYEAEEDEYEKLFSLQKLVIESARLKN